MNKRRFFSVVWRINALIILIAGILATAALVFAAVMVVRDMTRTRHANNIVNIAPGRDSRTKTRLGSFTKVQGAQVFRAPLHIEQEYELSVASKETTSVQNYLFYNPTTGQAYWLRRGPPVLFAETHELPQREYGDRTPISSFVYEIVERDTDGDQRLTASDAKIVALSDPTGTRMVQVARDVSEVHSVDMTSGDTALVIYTASGQLRAVTVNVITGAVGRDSAIIPDAKQR